MNNTASPIRKSATGKFIELGNAADKPLRGLKLYGRTEQVKTTGKNLLNMSGANGGTNSGITVTVNADGSYTINGTATDINVNVWFAGSYNANAPTLFVLPAGAYYVAGIALYSGTSLVSGNYQIAGSFFTLTKDTPITGVRCTFVTSGQTYTNRTVYPIVAAGTEAVKWEPYTGGIPGPNPNYPQELVNVGADGSIGAYSRGKNLIENTATNKSVNGVTYTVNDDGSVLVDGTATAQAEIIINKFRHPNGSYKLNGSTDNVRIFAVLRTADGTLYSTSEKGADRNITIDDAVLSMEIHAAVTAGSNANAETIKPMLRLASDTDATFEPYKDGSSVTVSTPNGLPGISVSSGGNYTDSTGQMWICDEVDFGRGVYVQRVKLFSLSQVSSWSQWGAHWYNHNYLNDSLATYNAIFGYCSHVRRNGITIDANYIAHSEVANGYGFGIQINSAAEKWGFTGSTAEEFKSFVDAKDIKLVYACHPIETPLSAEELASYRAMSTFDPYTVVYSDSDV